MRPFVGLHYGYHHQGVDSRSATTSRTSHCRVGLLQLASQFLDEALEVVQSLHDLASLGISFLHGFSTDWSGRIGGTLETTSLSRRAEGRGSDTGNIRTTAIGTWCQLATAHLSASTNHAAWGRTWMVRSHSVNLDTTVGKRDYANINRKKCLRGKKMKARANNKQ